MVVCATRKWLTAVAVAVVAWSSAGAVASAPSAGAADEVPVSTCGTALVAIPSADEVLPIDVLSGAVGTPIAIPGAYVVSISPDARTAYVVGNHATDPVWTLTTVDLATGAIGDPAPLDFLPDIGPVSNIVVSPDGARVYIGTGDKLGVIDAHTLSVIATIPYTGADIFGAIAITPDGRTAFVGNGSWVDVQVVDLVNDVAGPVIPAGSWPLDVSVSPDGSTVYTANENGTSVTPIDVATLSVRAQLPLPFEPSVIDVAPDGASAVVSNAYAIARLDLATGAVSSPVPLGSAMGTALLPDGRTDLIIDQSPPSAYAVDVDTGLKGPSISLPDVPTYIAAIAPSQAPTAAFTNGAGLSGQPTAFDASASTATCGDISAYRWDYGDGSVETTSTPTSTHVYATPGSYDVTLTVTDSAGTSTTKAFTGQAMLRNGGPTAQVAQQVAVAPGPVAAPHFTG